jgi:sulfatase maturation enzyme AslB (radical SAM superfamily)
MQFDHLVNTLEQQYSVPDMAWLEDLACQASSTLYRRWAPHLKPAYPTNVRFVLLNFAPVSESVLIHVSWLIEYLDISPCFVLVVTNQNATADWFNSQTRPVQVHAVTYCLPHALPDNQIIPQFNTNNTMCAHAWAGVHVWPNGETSVCCDFQGIIQDSQGQAFNIKSHTIDQILGSDYMNEVRDQFRQGQQPQACNNCWHNEQAGGESKHQLTPYKLSNIYPQINWESNSVDKNLGFVGGHLGNLCNLKCRICSPVFSSSIASEEINQEPDVEIKSHPTYRLLTDNRWSRNSADFWQQLRDRADQICNFEFLGGEPLLLKENIEFMQWLIDTGRSSRSTFEFVTNGTQYPAVFDQAHQFYRLTVTLSIDDLGPRFESQRYGATWDQVVKNLQQFVACRQRNPNMKIGVCITVNIQNVLYLPELVQWLNTQDIDHYYYNVLAQPSWISIDWLTPDARALVIDRLILADLLEPDRTKLFYVVNCVRSATTSDGKQFCQNMQIKDVIRQENFILTHQEIAKAMGFVLQSHND